MAQSFPDPRVFYNPPSSESQLSPKLLRDIRYELNPVEAGGERRYKDPAVGVTENFLQARHHVLLGAAGTWTINVRTVTKQTQHTKAAQLGQAVRI